MDKYIVIVAGGHGSRMGSDIPKQTVERCVHTHAHHRTFSNRRAASPTDSGTSRQSMRRVAQTLSET